MNNRTLGELKINCYKLIDPTDTDITAINIKDIYEVDTEYSFYFLNMLRSINGAITRINQACILPLKQVKISASTIYTSTLENCLDSEGNIIYNTDGSIKKYQPKKRATFDIKTYATDLYSIRHIEYENTEGNTSKIEYRKIGDFIDITNNSDGYYVIYYFPRINTIESYQGEIDNINDIDLITSCGLNNEILTLIPYYVKADLLEADKPTEAILARNTFEQYLASFEQPSIEEHKEFKSWWGGIL